jgi:hypothetical protein
MDIESEASQDKIVTLSSRLLETENCCDELVLSTQLRALSIVRHQVNPLQKHGANFDSRSFAKLPCLAIEDLGYCLSRKPCSLCSRSDYCPNSQYR